MKTECEYNTQFNINAGVRQACVLNPNFSPRIFCGACGTGDGWSHNLMLVLICRTTFLMGGLPTTSGRLFARSAQQALFLSETEELADTWRQPNANNTLVLTNHAQAPSRLVTSNVQNLQVKTAGAGHKWFGLHSACRSKRTNKLGC